MKIFSWVSFKMSKQPQVGKMWKKKNNYFHRLQAFKQSLRIKKMNSTKSSMNLVKLRSTVGNFKKQQVT